ncbi:MAG: VWA domain-containing protein, partial [Bdellovibrionales bacterium]|nr:VWA domain-containing protein [Bdellovibrionales bacterium]
MSFAYPWALLFPLIIYVPKLFLRPRKTSTIRFPDKQSLLPNRIESWRATLRAPILHSLCLAMLCFLAIAAARPQRVTPLPLPDTARNIMLALDVSGSMKTRDFIVGGQTANRLEAVKYVVSQFVERRKGDRIGLVIFGTESYLECPLTLDHDLVVRLIQNLSVGIAGEGTAIGDGLALGLKRISDVLEKQQDTRTSNRQNSSALILLTDGVNTSGSIDPIQAADVAKDLGVKI